MQCAMITLMLDMTAYYVDFDMIIIKLITTLIYCFHITLSYCSAISAFIREFYFVVGQHLGI